VNCNKVYSSLNKNFIKLVLCSLVISNAFATTLFQEEAVKLDCVLSAQIEPMLHTQVASESFIQTESYLLTVKTKKDRRKSDLKNCAKKIEAQFKNFKVVETSKLSNWLVVEKF